MKRVPLMVACAAVTVTLAAVAHHLIAETNGQIPNDHTECYHYLWTCSYEGSNAYWSGCSADAPTGLVITKDAASFCDVYHSS